MAYYSCRTFNAGTGRASHITEHASLMAIPWGCTAHSAPWRNTQAVTTTSSPTLSRMLIRASRAQVLQFAHGVIAALAEVPGCAEQALQMFLTGALAASEEARLEIIAYEFVEQVRGTTLGLGCGEALNQGAIRVL